MHGVLKLFNYSKDVHCLTLDIEFFRSECSFLWIPHHCYRIVLCSLNQWQDREFSMSNNNIMITLTNKLVHTCSCLLAVTNIAHVHRWWTPILSLKRSSNGVLNAMNLSESKIEDYNQYVLSIFTSNNSWFSWAI